MRAGITSGRGRFVGTGSLRVTAQSGPPLSAAAKIRSIEAAASERARLTGTAPNRLLVGVGEKQEQWHKLDA